MADRLSLIMQLGALATDAAQRGDDRAAESLQAAAALLFADKSAVDKVEQRRQRDRESRPVKQPRIPRQNPPKSSESTEIVGGSQGFSPTPPFPNSPIHHEDTAREAVYAESVENLLAMLEQRVGERWMDVDGFIRRRQFGTWKAWIKEMLSILTGGQSTVDDLAQVCRDDAALERPIGSPKGLRIFVASSARERLQGNQRSPPSSAARTGSPSRRDTKVTTGPALAPTDPETIKWQIP